MILRAALFLLAISPLALVALASHHRGSCSSFAAPPNSTSTDWALKWSPDPKSRTEGLGTFEGVEDDRANSHPGVKHIYIDGPNYRFDMHTIDRDGSDRQRNEVKGMRTTNDNNIIISKGETWRFTYSMFIPNTLNSTTNFTASERKLCFRFPAIAICLRAI